MFTLFILLFIFSIPLFILGVAKPEIFSKFISNRVQAVIVFGCLSLGLFFLVGITAPPADTEKPTISEEVIISATPIIEKKQSTKVQLNEVTEAPTPTFTPAPTNTPVPTVEPTSPSFIIRESNTSNSEWSCNCAKTCTQMSSCSEAYFQLNQCGCSKRDGDNDGVPCESIC